MLDVLLPQGVQLGQQGSQTLGFALGVVRRLARNPCQGMVGYRLKVSSCRLKVKG